MLPVLSVYELQKGDVIRSTGDGAKPLPFRRLIIRGGTKVPSGKGWKMGKRMLKAIGYSLVVRGEQVYTLALD